MKLLSYAGNRGDLGLEFLIAEKSSAEGWVVEGGKTVGGIERRLALREIRMKHSRRRARERYELGLIGGLDLHVAPGSACGQGAQPNTAAAHAVRLLKEGARFMHRPQLADPAAHHHDIQVVPDMAA